jgi:hypothetical protein
LLSKWRVSEENKKRKKEKIKLLIGKKMFLSNMNRSLVGVGDQ